MAIIVAVFSKTIGRLELLKTIAGLNSTVRNTLMHRLGYLNLLNPLGAEFTYELNMSHCDERSMAHLLLMLTQQGPLYWCAMSYTVYGSSTLLDMAPATWVAGDMPLEGVVKFTHAKLDKSETEESPGGEGDEDEKPPGSPVDKQAQSLKAQKEAELMAFMRETTTSFLRKLMLGPPASEVGRGCVPMGHVCMLCTWLARSPTKLPV